MKLRAIGPLLETARAKLRALGIETAALDARFLLQAASGLSHEELIAGPELVLDARSVQIFDAFVARRTLFEPVSRILGWREFYGRRFHVTPHVLDPRPDTEAVVQLALDSSDGKKQFLDLGTGSGIIAVTLCAEREDFRGVASDVSEAALDVARENAALQQVSGQLSFHHGAWFDGLPQQFDLIISNPPYIPRETALMPDVFHYDPHLALFGGDDGLDAYRAISAGAGKHLAPDGQIIVEIGLGQADDIKAIFEAHRFQQSYSNEDLGGRLRALAFKASQPR